MTHPTLLRTLPLSLLLATILCTPPALRADDAVELERVAVKIDASSRRPEAHADLYTRISVDTGVPVVTLKEHHAKWKVGFGELYLVHLLARSSGRSCDDLLAARRAGQGWGQIAKANGLKLGPLVSQARKSEQAIARSANGKTTAAADPNGRSDTKGKPGERPTPAGSPHGTSAPSGNAKGGSGGKGGGKGK